MLERLLNLWVFFTLTLTLFTRKLYVISHLIVCEAKTLKYGKKTTETAKEGEANLESF